MPRLECSGTIIAHSSLKLLGSRDPPTLASRLAGTRGTCHHVWLIYRVSGLSTLCRLVSNSWSKVIILS